MKSLVSFTFDDLYPLTILYPFLLYRASIVPPSLSLIEKIMQWFLFVEKNILYPLTFLFAFNLSAHHYKARFGDL